MEQELKERESKTQAERLLQKKESLEERIIKTTLTTLKSDPDSMLTMLSGQFPLEKDEDDGFEKNSNQNNENTNNAFVVQNDNTKVRVRPLEYAKDATPEPIRNVLEYAYYQSNVKKLLIGKCVGVLVVQFNPDNPDSHDPPIYILGISGTGLKHEGGPPAKFHNESLNGLRDYLTQRTETWHLADFDPHHSVYNLPREGQPLDDSSTHKEFKKVYAERLFSKLDFFKEELDRNGEDGVRKILGYWRTRIKANPNLKENDFEEVLRFCCTNATNKNGERNQFLKALNATPQELQSVAIAICCQCAGKDINNGINLFNNLKSAQTQEEFLDICKAHAVKGVFLDTLGVATGLLKPPSTNIADWVSRCAEDNAVQWLWNNLAELKKGKQVTSIEIQWYSTIRPKKDSDIEHLPLCPICAVCFVPRTRSLLTYCLEALIDKSKKQKAKKKAKKKNHH